MSDGVEHAEKAVRRPDGHVDRGLGLLDDLEVGREVPELERHAQAFFGEDLLLGHQGEPEEEGQDEGEELEPPVPDDQVLEEADHVFKYSRRRFRSSSVSGIVDEIALDRQRDPSRLLRDDDDGGVGLLSDSPIAARCRVRVRNSVRR